MEQADIPRKKQVDAERRRRGRDRLIEDGFAVGHQFPDVSVMGAGGKRFGGQCGFDEWSNPLDEDGNPCDRFGQSPLHLGPDGKPIGGKFGYDQWGNPLDVNDNPCDADGNPLAIGPDGEPIGGKLGYDEWGNPLDKSGNPCDRFGNPLRIGLDGRPIGGRGGQGISMDGTEGDSPIGRCVSLDLWPS